jgi:hypothetical protein
MSGGQRFRRDHGKREQFFLKKRLEHSNQLRKSFNQSNLKLIS